MSFEIGRKDICRKTNTEIPKTDKQLVVSWSVSISNDSALVCDTLRKAISNRNPSKGLIFHSDHLVFF